MPWPALIAKPLLGDLPLAGDGSERVNVLLGRDEGHLRGEQVGTDGHTLPSAPVTDGMGRTDLPIRGLRDQPGQRAYLNSAAPGRRLVKFQGVANDLYVGSTD